MNKTPKLSIIIVNYYSEDLVLNCVKSIHQNNLTEDLIEIIIVDNGSDVNTLNQLNNSARIIKNATNKGFGFACNLGVKIAKSNLILFLNPDTKVFKNTLSDAIVFFEANSQITVLGCQQVDENSKILKTCTTFITLRKYIVKSFYLDKLFPKIIKSYLLTYWDHRDSRFVDHVMGSFYMIRKKDFERLNGFDERFFVYYEDADLSKRILKNGGKIYYNTNFKIYHEGGGASKKVKAERLFYSLDAVLEFAKKHFSKLDYNLLFLFICFIEFLLRLFLAIIKLNLEEIIQLVRAYNLLYKKRIFKQH